MIFFVRVKFLRSVQKLDQQLVYLFILFIILCYIGTQYKTNFETDHMNYHKAILT